MLYLIQGEFCAVNIIIASILCQAKWPVYRGGRTSESRNSESLLYIIIHRAVLFFRGTLLITNGMKFHSTLYVCTIPSNLLCNSMPNSQATYVLILAIIILLCIGYTIPTRRICTHISSATPRGM